jgi:hypothetical protein
MLEISITPITIPRIYAKVCLSRLSFEDSPRPPRDFKSRDISRGLAPSVLTLVTMDDVQSR